MKCCTVKPSHNWVLYFICPGRGIFPCIQHKALFFFSFLYFPQNTNQKGVSVTCVATIQLQYEEFVSPIPTKMLVFQPCDCCVISLILYFLLANINLPQESVWLRFRDIIYLVMHVCISISAQFFCKIEIMPFWVHLNYISTCVIITNLFWYPLFQDIIMNHSSGCIVVFSNLIKPDSIDPINKSWRYIILSLLPSD